MTGKVRKHDMFTAYSFKRNYNDHLHQYKAENLVILFGIQYILKRLNKRLECTSEYY